MNRKGPDEKNRKKKAAPVNSAAGPAGERQVGEKVLRLQDQAKQSQTAKAAQHTDAASENHARNLG
jgi:hypothetical protein